MNKKRIYFQSVFSRFSFAVLTILIFSFAVLILINGVAINYYYSDLRKEELSYVSVAASEEIEDGYRHFLRSYSDGSFWEREGDTIAEALSKLTDDTAAFLLISDENGHVRYVDPSAQELSIQAINEIYLPFNHNNTVEYEQGNLGLFNEEHYYSASNIYLSDTYVATVFVCLPVSVVKRPVNATVSLITVVSIGVMGVTLFASYLVSRRITNPLAKMSEAAKAFADGDFSVRVPIIGQDEIGEFAKVFNEMADSLERIEKTRNDFIANVSHDLRSPMTSITGYIDGMLNGVIPPEKHEHYLGVVLEETKRLSRLVTTLLDISRIQAGERKFVMSCFDICETTRQILFSFESRVEEKNLDVVFEFDDERMYVMADQDAIYQVLYNLADNAVKFSRDGGKLVLSVTEKDAKILVSVYNEGEGVLAEELCYVFDRFYKADKSRGMDKTGTGLGLYITKKIIEAHKETIIAESDYGHFCRFSFTLLKGDIKARRQIQGTLK